MTDLNKLNKKLNEIKDDFNTWRNSGLSEKLLKVWIKHRTKLSDKDINKVLKSLDEFFNELILIESVKNL